MEVPERDSRLRCPYAGQPREGSRRGRRAAVASRPASSRGRTGAATTTCTWTSTRRASRRRHGHVPFRQSLRPVVRHLVEGGRGVTARNRVDGERPLVYLTFGTVVRDPGRCDRASMRSRRSMSDSSSRSGRWRPGGAGAAARQCPRGALRAAEPRFADCDVVASHAGQARSSAHSERHPPAVPAAGQRTSSSTPRPVADRRRAGARA